VTGGVTRARQRNCRYQKCGVNEPYFPGHFPYHPVMPGVLIIEAMAQAAAILSFKNNGYET